MVERDGFFASQEVPGTHMANAGKSPFLIGVLVCLHSWLFLCFSMVMLTFYIGDGHPTFNRESL